MSQGWRSVPLPPDWQRIRIAVFERDGFACTAINGDGRRCYCPAKDVHHIGDPNDHRIENLTTLCRWHHERVTSRQANAARARVTQQREREPHPGIRP